MTRKNDEKIPFVRKRNPAVNQAEIDQLPVAADGEEHPKKLLRSDDSRLAGSAPRGPAGGDLSGKYPNPTLKKIRDGGTYQSVNLTVDSKGRVVEASDGTAGQPDANSTTKGLVELTKEATDPTNPKALGDNDGRVPSSGQAQSLVGTHNPPGVDNPYVTNSDSRLTDSRNPSQNAGGDLAGAYPNPSLIAQSIAQGQYTNVNLTVDANGRITAVENGTAPTVTEPFGLQDEGSGVATYSILNIVGDGAQVTADTPNTRENLRIDGTFHRGTTPPSNPQSGWLWLDANTTPATLKEYTGSAWEIPLIGPQVLDEGSALTKRSTLNFTGLGVSATDDATNGLTRVNVPSKTIQDKGTPKTLRTNLNFSGMQISVADNSASDRTDVTLADTVPAWAKQTGAGSVFVALGDGNPIDALRIMDTVRSVAGPTATQVSTFKARLVEFRLPRTLASFSAYWHQLSAPATAIYRFGIYEGLYVGSGDRIWDSGTFTGAAGWNSQSVADVTLTKDTEYWLAFTVTATRTTADFRSQVAYSDAGIFDNYVSPQPPFAGRPTGVAEYKEIDVTSGVLPSHATQLLSPSWSTATGTLPLVFWKGTAS